MPVILAESAGFCFGVSRAVELVQSSAAAGKRTVTLGEYDAMTGTYAVTDGLSESDYVAYPDENCVEGAATTREKPAETIPEDGMNNGMNSGVDTGMINGGIEVG